MGALNRIRLAEILQDSQFGDLAHRDVEWMVRELERLAGRVEELEALSNAWAGAALKGSADHWRKEMDASAPTAPREAAEPWHSLCVECGPNVPADEDGCCSMCGATATGDWLTGRAAARDAKKEGEK